MRRFSRNILLMASMVVAMVLAGGVALALPSETPDQTLMVNGPVRTIEQVGNNVWVGGNFTQVQQRNGTVVANVSDVAVFDSATGDLVRDIHNNPIAPKLGAGGTTSIVRDIDVYGDDVVIGGDIPGPSSTQRNLVVVDGSTGGLISWYNSAKLQSVLAAPDLGRIYGGGQSLSAFEVATGKLLWSRAKTFVDTSIHSHNPPAGYKDLERDGSTIWGACVCDDLSVSPSKAWALVKLSTEGERDASWVADVRSTDLMGISVTQTADKLFLGTGGSDWVGAFSKANGSRIWRMDTSGSTQVVDKMDGQLVIGGHFVKVADDGTPTDTTPGDDNCGFRSSDPKTLDPNKQCQDRKGLAAYSFDGKLEPDWDPMYEGLYALVWALHVDGTNLHTGGEFLTVNGVKQTYYARLSTPLDTTAPTISNVAPTDGLTEVALEQPVVAAFSESIDSSTLTSTSFTLSEPYGTPVPASVSYDPTTKEAILDPDLPLNPQSTYTATIKGGPDGVKDSAGNALANDKIWSFTTTLPCTISGTGANNTITGTSGDDVICAGAGNDTIQALEGNDTIKGEGGADQLYGGIGNDHLNGGAGTDTANFSGSQAIDGITASLEAGTSTGEGSDTFSEVENVIGSSQPDTLRGSAANNTLNGGGGNDSIVGLGGSDTLKGIGGNDTLDSRDGVKGNDTVDGGSGTDTCLMDAPELSILSCEL